MFHYSNYDLSIVITVPIITILLLWTLVIFYKNKSSWRAYDITIVAILVEAVLRNASIICYIILQKLAAFSNPTAGFDICTAFIWLFNSTHTFQAGCLTTLAIVGLFSIKLYRKQQNLKQYLTATHVIYHLFCLTILCACVGVAAILATQENSFGAENIYCNFMPYQLDIKFNAFIIILHIFLALISFLAFIYITFIYFRLKRAGFDYLKKSTSDLSELSVQNEPKNFYDTYTIQRNFGPYDSPQAALNGYTTIWKSDVSNVSTTVSSTNSRKPLSKDNIEEKPGTGLETIHPILIVCYLFYHLPVIVLCVFPNWVAPWSVATIALWLGLLQDVMIPVGLGLIDTRFTQWVTKVYRCSSKKTVEGKLPHVGLDGKFRHFGSQPQSLEVTQMLPERLPGRCGEHKFPITNGSLYTSIEGRVPIIHNYRRHNNENRGVKLDGGNLLNLGIHSSNLKRQEQEAKPKTSFRCSNCEKPHCSNSANLKYTNSNTDLIRNSAYNLNVNPPSYLLKPYLRHVSLSQNSLRQMPLGKPIQFNSNSKNVRLTKSYDSLNDLNKFKSSLDSEDEYFTDSHLQNFDTLSTESSFSITTEANCDFEFYQHEKPKKTSRNSSKNSSFTDLGKNFKIKRSNSKRSLENLQSFVSEGSFFNLQRSNSFVGTEERKRKRPLNMSVEFLQQGREGTFLDLPSDRKQFYAGSVPDLKKIFISEYI